MAVTEVFTGVAAADYDSALVWYERLMGRPPDVAAEGARGRLGGLGHGLDLPRRRRQPTAPERRC